MQISDILFPNHVLKVAGFDSILSFRLFIPAFFFRKKGYINFVSKSVRRPSVCPSVPSVRPCVRPSVTFLVNVSPPKPLEIATSNFVGE